MSYKPYKKSIPLRTESTLITYSIPTEDPNVLIPPSYNKVAPGLYPDEKVYELDTGELIALSVGTRRIPTGAGMEFRGWARVIELDGSTMRDAHRAEMELEFHHPVDAGIFDRIDTEHEPNAEDMIARELMLMMLGEEPTMVPVHVDLDAPVVEVATDDADWKRNKHKAPPGTVLNPGETEAPLIGWSDEVRMNASIRHALKMFKRTKPEVDVSTLL